MSSLSLSPSVNPSICSGCRFDATRWPADRPSLAALVDLGLSDRQIGRYFEVSPDDVYMLRDLYRLSRR